MSLKKGGELKVKKASERLQVINNPENVKFLLACLLGFLVATAFPKLSDTLQTVISPMALKSFGLNF
jgi:hypothetical protein